METHENEIPDEDLPGYGIFDLAFIRSRLKEQEQAGLLAWVEEEQTYEPTSRTVIAEIGSQIIGKAAEIDPRATPDEIVQAVVSCIPWPTSVTKGDPQEFEIPDFVPEDFA